LTLKALKTIRACDVLAFPKPKADGKAAAYEIVKTAIPDLGEKETLALFLPMTKDRAVMQESQKAAAALIIDRLESRRTVAFLTLGDPSIYSTYTYLSRLVQNKGYETAVIPGVPSFCAAAALLREDLVSGDQILHIIPGSCHDTAAALDLAGVKVLMKMGASIPEVTRLLAQKGAQAQVVENCGMERQRVWSAVSEIDEHAVPAGYFTTIIVKDEDPKNTSPQGGEG
jgi:precorrin-2/cobalt-factor-2 C20-methyltransferase